MNLKIRNRKMAARMRRFVMIMTALLLAAAMASCSLGRGEDKPGLADYGDEGAQFAHKLALSYPRRTPFSDQEKGAADLLMEELQKLGYTPEKQSFTIIDEDGVRKTSANIIARLDGQGFSLSQKLTDEEREGQEPEIHDLVMVIGAHYDTPFVPVDEPEEGEPAEPVLADGIHNNASGVAAVLTAARIMREETPGYRVVFVFFGAGTEDYQGARHYLSSLSTEERSKIDVMVNVGPIFAGDKVYAHAGQNSVLGGEYKDYAKRRKLYQATDIFFENQMNTRNRYALYTNQSSLLIDREDQEPAVFREWTTTLSDHTPFDQAGIPVVFFESGEYRIQSLADVGLESRNPYFLDTGGLISGTSFDRAGGLEELFRQMDEQEARQTLPSIDEGDRPGTETDETDEEDKEEAVIVPRLPQRINNTAFVLVQLARKGPLNYDFKE